MSSVRWNMRENGRHGSQETANNKTDGAFHMRWRAIHWFHIFCGMDCGCCFGDCVVGSYDVAWRSMLKVWSGLGMIVILPFSDYENMLGLVFKRKYRFEIIADRFINSSFLWRPCARPWSVGVADFLPQGCGDILHHRTVNDSEVKADVASYNIEHLRADVVAGVFDLERLFKVNSGYATVILFSCFPSMNSAPENPTF